MTALSLSPRTAAPVASGSLRHALEVLVSDLRVAAQQLRPRKFATALADAALQFETKSLDARAAALNTSIQRFDGEPDHFDWLAEQYSRLAAASRTMVERMLQERKLDPPERAKVIAYAMLFAGHESKWQQMVGEQNRTVSVRRYHQLLAGAMAEKIAESIVQVRIEGEEIETTIESLYVRALLLERLASGNLNARQIEILDNWLVAWMRSLMLVREQPDTTSCFVAHLDRAEGLSIVINGAATTSNHRTLYLPLPPLLRQLDRAIEHFHHGMIFPGFGLGMTFRIEEHLNVISYLTREFSMLNDRARQKSPRTAIEAGHEVAVYFGLNDIIGRALQTQDATRAQVERAHMVMRPTHANDSTANDQFARTGTFTVFDPARKVLAVVDASESGLGLTARVADTRKMEVGDLAAIRCNAHSPVHLGVVSRKTARARGDEELIGVNFLSRAIRALSLDYPSSGESTRPPATALFIAGEDATGRGDSLVVSETVYRAQTRFRVTLGEKTDARHYWLTLGRIKQQGRGWKMCAFDVVADTGV